MRGNTDLAKEKPEVFAKGKPWVDLHQIWNIYIFQETSKFIRWQNNFHMFSE